MNRDRTNRDRTNRDRLCENCCHDWRGTSDECPICGHDTSEQDYERGEERPRKLTRMERLEAAADAGHDTWDDYRGER